MEKKNLPVKINKVKVGIASAKFIENEEFQIELDITDIKVIKKLESVIEPKFFFLGTKSIEDNGVQVIQDCDLVSVDFVIKK